MKYYDFLRILPVQKAFKQSIWCLIRSLYQRRSSAKAFIIYWKVPVSKMGATLCSNLHYLFWVERVLCNRMCLSLFSILWSFMILSALCAMHKVLLLKVALLFMLFAQGRVYVPKNDRSGPPDLRSVNRSIMFAELAKTKTVQCPILLSSWASTH
jgi:hypothetical protein